MSLSFTNVHTHVFNSRCAPDNFLRILPMNTIRRFPGTVKSLLDSKMGRTTIHFLAKRLSKKDSNKRGEFDKYIAFLDIGLQRSQKDVFEIAFSTAKQYDPSARVVGLTMNMDYMDSVSSKDQKSFVTQLEEVKEIKRYYPDNFFPFLGIDPRHKSGSDLENFAKQYFETGFERNGKVYPYFSGIKIYPALGFFPFDPRLYELYEYANENDIPIITHCTRVGSQYIGSQIQNLIPAKPDMILPPLPPNLTKEEKDKYNAFTAQTSIYARIDRFMKNNWVRNSKIGDNDYACDLFGHPENYITLLETFPKLKICLAHMGGSNEIYKIPKKEIREVRDADGCSWFEKTWEMMKTYPNLYTDISYTLSSFDETGQEILNRTISLLDSTSILNKSLSDRVLFGTDFFMTEQEKRESELYSLTKVKLANWFDKLTKNNPQNYLR